MKKHGNQMRLELSVIIPIYNEEAVLPLLISRLLPILESITTDFEVLFVNDGSSDRSAALLREISQQDDRLRVLHFSRNFGHQVAVTAGLDFAGGEAVVIMDGDLQDPPELLPEMIQKWQEGFDVVSAQRILRSGETAFKKATAAVFYWVMQRLVDSRIQREVGDFRLLSHRAVLAVREFREQHRFMRGLIAWLGLREAVLPFARKERAAGSTKYPLIKMIQFSWTAVTSFSAVPLRLTVLLGFASGALGFAILFWALFYGLILRRTVPGWASLIATEALFSGITLVAVGVTGEYVARIYEEIKRRPLYVLTEVNNASFAPEASRCIVLPPVESPRAHAPLS